MAVQVCAKVHAGLFWSPRIERTLDAIGRRLETPPPRSSPRGVKRVLHVHTDGIYVGGSTKMLSLWLQADRGRHNDVAITWQHGRKPDFLLKAAAEAGGKVTFLDRLESGMVARARRLRKIAQDYDLIVTHLQPEDVSPLIAFAQPDLHPPVVILNLNDHIFWPGASICALNLNLREAALDLAVLRRGIAAERNTLLPTLAEAVHRKRSREEAKRALGIDPEVTLLVSVARWSKYRTMGARSYADIHAPILAARENAILIAVGPGEPEDWSAGIAATNGRIRGVTETPDPRPYLEAADIYLDSYPFISSTAMMEPAGYGLPMASLATHPPDARIFEINHLAISPLRPNSSEENGASFRDYEQIVLRLIDDRSFREAKGESARAQVVRHNNMPGWGEWLEKAYGRAIELPPLDNRALLAAEDDPRFGEIDRRHQAIFPNKWDMEPLLADWLGMLPTRQRIEHWIKLKPELRRVNQLFPWTLKRRLVDLARGEFGAVARPAQPKRSA
jgi:hypothetical protein